MENANQLSLVLTTPVEDLIPALLAWNNEELLSAVNERLIAYRGKTYTDDEVVAAKADRAQLNAFCKALNDERIRIGKVYSAPYDKFKKEVDEVVATVKVVVNEIDKQVETFETEKNNAKPPK